MRHQLVVAGDEAVLVLLLQQGIECFRLDLLAAESNDFGQLHIVDVERVAQAAQYIVIEHGAVLKRAGA
ncbi:hypothetical protein D3C80_1909240 [compost metagenome]